MDITPLPNSPIGCAIGLFVKAAIPYLSQVVATAFFYARRETIHISACSRANRKTIDKENKHIERFKGGGQRKTDAGDD